MSGEPASTEEAVELWLAERGSGAASAPLVFAARFPALGPELADALLSLQALERAESAPDELELPERIGAFRIVRELGRGGMGVVLEAIEEPLGRRVALKVLPADALSSAAARSRFEREARLAARLDHPGIATVYGAGVADGRPWIAMRLVEGATLAELVADARKSGARAVRLAQGAGPRALARLLAEVARALAFAHDAGVIHRDVKPSNVIVTPSGAPVLVDFGLALAAEPDGHTLTRTGDTAGTPAYLAPEIVGGEHARPDAQCDVYALGVTLYECLALRRPFDAPTPIALYRAIMSGSMPALRTLNRAVPRDLAVVVATALERDRARRYASAAALAADLEACAAGRPVAARPVPLAGRIARWARREPRQAVLAGLAIAATLAAGGFFGSWAQSRSTVRAAERLTTQDRYDRAVTRGYDYLAVNWLPEAEHEFENARAIDASDEVLASLAIVLLKARRDADAVALLEQAPATPAFDGLRALAGGGAPVAEHPASWVAQAPAFELFVDGMGLIGQAERAPPAEAQRLAAIALRRFEEAIGRSRTARYAYHVQRTVAAHMTRDEDAIRSAAAAITVLWGDNARGIFSAGLALSDVDPQAALPYLERVVALDPGWNAPHQVLGNVLWRTGDLEGAVRSLQRALELDPLDVHAWNSLGVVLGQLGCLAESGSAYEAALAIQPMFATWANKGLLDARGTQTELAERELRTALDLAPRENGLREALAELLHRTGRTREAVAELETALGFDAAHASALELYAAWQTELGEHEQAALASELSRELASAP